MRKGSYGTFAATDGAGRLTVELPRTPASLDVDITTPGFGPYLVCWSSESRPEPIPARFTAELEAGWSVGGVIVDTDGQPVKGAKIHPGIEFKKRPGDRGQMGVGTELQTDAAGKWRFDSVPVSINEISVNIDHPAFRPVLRQMTRGAFGIETGRDPGKVILDRGLTVVGRVSDEAGKPVVGALVRTKFTNDIREAKTGADGVYRLAGCVPRAVRIVVSAKGRATDMKELNIEPTMGPVDFQMKPGGSIRIRVLDERGQAVPKARIFFQRWRGSFAYFEFSHVSQYADENGVWVWNEAPLDEFKADICRPGGMQLDQQSLISREQEYVFRTPPALVISGKVIDAVTKEPIKKFRVVPGTRSIASTINWIESEVYAASGGGYRISRHRGDFAHLVRIEADGYQTAVSRDIKSDEGSISIDFELVKGSGIVGKVVTPRNVPASGAKVALAVGTSQIIIKNDAIYDSSTYSMREDTDEAGRFNFASQSTDFQLVITHPSGYAHLSSSAEWPLVRIIHLEPWSRAEGTFRIGRAPVPHVPITIQSSATGPRARNGPRVFTFHDATTGPDGRFVFDRVLPGSGRIGRRITLTEGGATEIASSVMVAANFPAGETVRIDLGGTGRPVVGKLRPPEGFNENVRWNFALVTGRPDLIAGRREGPSFTTFVGPDSTFRIDDVPQCSYVLYVFFQRDRVGQLQDHRFRSSRGGGRFFVAAGRPGSFDAGEALREVSTSLNSPTLSSRIFATPFRDVGVRAGHANPTLQRGEPRRNPRWHFELVSAALPECQIPLRTPHRNERLQTVASRRNSFQNG